MHENPAVVVANGPLSWTETSASLTVSAPVCLAADGGANHLALIGLRPRLVIGDLDSITNETRAWVGEERLVLRPDQDLTDLEKTLDHAFGPLGLERIAVLAALGGRVDHEIGNLGLLYRLALGEALTFVSDHTVVLAATGDLELVAQPGETWSFWTYDPAVLVSLEGVRWRP